MLFRSILFLPSYLTKGVLSVGMPSFRKKNFLKGDSGRIIELEKFKTCKLSYLNLWSVHKLILNLICLVIRHNHDTHLLIERSIQICNVSLKYEFVIVNSSTPYIIVNDVFFDLFEVSHE